MIIVAVQAIELTHIYDKENNNGIKTKQVDYFHSFVFWLTHSSIIPISKIPFCEAKPTTLKRPSPSDGFEYHIYLLQPWTMCKVISCSKEHILFQLIVFY